MYNDQYQLNSMKVIHKQLTPLVRKTNRPPKILDTINGRHFLIKRPYLNSNATWSEFSPIVIACSTGRTKQQPITGDFDTDGNTLHFLISNWILKYERKNMKFEICFENLLEFWDIFIYSAKMSFKLFLN